MIRNNRYGAPAVSVRSIAPAIMLLISFASVSFAQDGFVTTRGREIVTPDGKPILLKGINLGNWLEPEGYMFKFRNADSPRLIYEVFDELVGPEKAQAFWKGYRRNYITKKDIDFIRSAGFNSVRVPFDYRLFVRFGTPPQWDSTGLFLLDSVVTWCKEAGLWAILDMHCAPGGQTGANIDDSYGYPFLFEGPKAQQLTVELWQRIAERYRNNTAVLGYDLLNEPIAPYFDVAKLNPYLEPLYKKITAAIRTVDTNHIVILGGAQWDGNFKSFGKPFAGKLVYTFHKYWSDTTESVIKEYVDFRNEYNVPVWLGESGENKYEWIAGFRRLLEKNDIGWCFWPYKKLEAPTCIASIPMTKEYRSIIAFADTDRSTFKKIRDARPDITVVGKAMSDYLRDCKLSHCTINDGYLKALGLKGR